MKCQGTTKSMGSRCTREATEEVDGSHYCTQHAKLARPVCRGAIYQAPSKRSPKQECPECHQVVSTRKVRWTNGGKKFTARMFSEHHLA